MSQSAQPPRQSSPRQPDAETLPAPGVVLDPADQAVITQALLAAANEMGAKLIRSAHSPIVREASDCSTALLDRHGNVVSQAELIPLQLGSISHTFAPCAAVVAPEQLREGDFYINNDPFNGGQHVPDVFIYTPIFFEDRLIGFSASVAHHIDLGGGAPGLNPNATDVHQEGIILPPSCYNIDRDWNGGPLERLLRANIRMPDATVGDFNAQFAANRIGAQRVRELCRKHGVETVLQVMDAIQDYSERRLRAAIAEIPDGVYVGEDALDDDAHGSGPLPIRATVTIAGSDISVDFEGSSPQVKSNMNNPFASTVGATASVVKSVLTDADIPFNTGSSRVLKVSAPYGSILNPRPPAPVRARLLPSYRVFDAVMKAFAQVVPDRVIASGYDTTTSACLSHLSERGYNIYLEIFGGGYGAGPQGDGCDAVDSPLSNCSNIPIEAIDMTYDFFRVLDYSLVEHSGGDGQHRGGLGVQRIFEVLCDDVTFATYADRFKIAPTGLFGGGPGACARTWVERGNERIELGAKQSFPLRRGDRLVLQTGGGGGYGDPALRSAADRERDRLDGLHGRRQG
ncbi:MAG: hydantoinase B/oxoprolinase family protein [Gammaproteobacteria bacterium]|nr:hydantoinase B/oxoprolinase family protein [Gammaproteobacteria bacterium]